MADAGFQHRALVYEGADEYLAGTVPFLWAALEAEEPVLVAVGQEKVKLLEAELGGDAPWVHFMAMEEVGRNPAAIIPLWRNFLDESGGPVRGIAEPVWHDRGPAVLEECHRHEALLNLAFANDPVLSLLCPYDSGSLSADAIERVAVSHRHVERKGRAEESGAFDAAVDCFAGELSAPASAPETTLTFGLTELKEVRDRVASAAEGAGMDSRGVADLVIATSELAANSVMHGGGTGTLRLWRENGSLLAEVEDRGRIEEPLVGRLRPGITQEGGRGLWLANRLCDLVQIRSGEGGTMVRLHVLVGERAGTDEPFSAPMDPRTEPSKA